MADQYEAATHKRQDGKTWDGEAGRTRYLGNLPTDCLQATENKKTRYQKDSGVFFSVLVPER